MVLGVAFQVFGQFPDPARQQRDLNVCAAGVLPVQLELLDVQRFRILSHFEAPILDEDPPSQGVSPAPTNGVTGERIARRGRPKKNRADEARTSSSSAKISCS